MSKSEGTLGGSPEKKSEKKKMGRPPREQHGEPIKTLRVYSTIARMLNDITNWRKLRRGLPNYAVADCVDEVLSKAVLRVWHAEVSMAAISKVSDSGEWETRDQPGDFALRVLGVLDESKRLNLMVDSNRFFDIRQMLGNDGRYMVEVGERWYPGRYGVFPGDYLIVKSTWSPNPGTMLLAWSGHRMHIAKLAFIDGADVILTGVDYPDGAPAGPTDITATRDDDIIGELEGLIRIKF